MRCRRRRRRAVPEEREGEALSLLVCAGKGKEKKRGGRGAAEGTLELSAKRTVRSADAEDEAKERIRVIRCRSIWHMRGREGRVCVLATLLFCTKKRLS